MKTRMLAAWACAGLCHLPLAEAARTTTYGYTTAGLTESVDGPRTDISDLTTFAYDAAGNRATMINPLGHVTHYPDYDGAGRLLRMVDPNGLETTFTYHPRGWLLSTTVNDGDVTAITAFDYDAAGNLTRVTPPSSGLLDFTYDSANRLTSITDHQGNTVRYTLDAMGNRVNEQFEDPQGIVTRKLDRVYNSLNRMIRETGADTTRTANYAYDANGNLTQSIDGLSRTENKRYDALNRLIRQVDPSTAQTDFAYDPRGNLSSVTDPRGNTTSYIHNAFDEVISQTSPDTGTTTFNYDDAGNVSSRTDARGVTIGYTYDALNRLIGISYPDATLDVKLAYDQGENGIGRLTRMQDASGISDYLYDRRGNLLQETRSIDSLTFVTGYEYDASNRLVSLTYPSGNRVRYIYDPQGRALSATLERPDNSTQELVQNLTYLPFGPINAMQYGNGLTLTRVFDQDYRLQQQLLPGVLDDNYAFDAVDNIINWDDSLDPLRSQSFGYDRLDRLLDADGPYGILSYAYDALGNRVSKDDGQTAETYAYQVDNNRLLEIDDGSTELQTFDAAGNLTTSAAGGFVYDDSNRLVEFMAPGVMATYAFNGKGERMKKTVNGIVTYFRYTNGQLIGEYDRRGQAIREYAYIDGHPIALISGSEAAHGKTQTVLQKVSTNHDWVNVDLGAFAGAPVIIAGPPSFNGTQAAIVAMQNIGPTGAQAAIREWEYLDGAHLVEDFPLLAMMPGRHVRQDGSVWEFGRVGVSGTKTWQTVPFTSTFAGAPKVFVTVQTSNDVTPVTARVRNVESGHFQVALFEEEALQNGHPAETVGYLAVYSPSQAGQVDLGGGLLTYQLQSGELDERWAAYSGAKLMLQEEQSRDRETNHLLERIDTLKLGGYLFAQDVTSDGGDTAAIRRRGALPNLTYQAISQSSESELYYAHTDHLGAVSKLSDESQQVVWDADRLPFGELDIITGQVEMPLRFPGQYHDEESGLYYNYFRDYDPATGRYIQSDPIGLGGGLNTYAYVGGNPLIWTDPYGLWKWHGNWGGPGWGGGRDVPEGQLTPDDFKVPPKDDRDACYFGHDKCIFECQQNQQCEGDESGCIRKCDQVVGNCLRRLPPGYNDTGFFGLRNDLEGWAFRTIIPLIWH